MAAPTGADAPSGKLVIRDIGLLLSGRLEQPILDADTIVAENGKITGIGRAKDVDTEGATTIVDAAALTVSASIVLHGLSARVLTDRYVRWLARKPPTAGIEAAATTVHVPAGGVRWPASAGVRQPKVNT